MFEFCRLQCPERRCDRVVLCRLDKKGFLVIGRWRSIVKEEGVLSLLLFAIHTDCLLKSLEESGVGCHMGGHFTGALAYADDITLLSPSMSGLRTLSKVCEEYATDFDVRFNGKKVSCCFSEVDNVYFLI